MLRYAPQCILPLILFLSSFCFAQVDGTLVISATSTGSAAGEIAVLTVSNTGDEEVNFALESRIIPPLPLAGGKLSQAYVTLPLMKTVIPPDGADHQISLRGYSLDFRKPTIPAGTGMPEFNSWLVPAKATDESIMPNLPAPSRAEQLQNQLREQLGREFSLTYDIYSNPELVGALVFPALAKISDNYSSLLKQEKINSPFERGSEREADQVIQQSLWIYTSRLEARDYSRSVFEKAMNQQFRARFGKSHSNAEPALRRSYTSGVESLWNTALSVLNFIGDAQNAISEEVENLPVAPEDKDPSLSEENEIAEETKPDEPAPQEEVAEVVEEEACACQECEVVSSFSALSISPFSDQSFPMEVRGSDPLPFGVYLSYDLPVVAGACTHCEEAVNGIHHSIFTPLAAGEPPIKEELAANSLYLHAPGTFEMASDYTCSCLGQDCPPVQTSKNLIVSRANPCDIGGNSVDVSTLDLGNNQSILLSGDSLKIRLLAPEQPVSILLPLDLAALIAQKDHPVFSRLLGGEENFTTPLSPIRHKLAADGMYFLRGNGIASGPAYLDHLLIRSKDPGRSIFILLSTSPDNCLKDASLLVEKKSSEYSLPSISSDDLFRQVEALDKMAIEDMRYWVQSLYLGFQLVKGLKADPGSYGTNYRFWKGKCEGAMIRLMNNMDDPEVKAIISEVTNFSFTNPPPGEYLDALSEFIFRLTSLRTAEN